MRLLSDIVRDVRPLPVALAHCMIRAKPGTERMELLNKLFRSTLPAAQMFTRVEMAECRAAIRGEREAVVMPFGRRT